MKYVDGFVIVLKKNKLKDYISMAKKAGKIWIKHGALEYFECVGEELNPKVPQEMKGITFPQLTKIKKDENVVFSFIVYKSKAHRNIVNAKVMKDSSMNAFEGMEMPFDMKKMSYGGFETIVEERK